MFKVGDKVVCINDGDLYKELKINKIYIIKRIDKSEVSFISDTFLLENMSSSYYSYRFKLLFDFRKQKIKKICSKLVIK